MGKRYAWLGAQPEPLVRQYTPLMAEAEVGTDWREQFKLRLVTVELKHRLEQLRRDDQALMLQEFQAVDTINDAFRAREAEVVRRCAACSGGIGAATGAFVAVTGYACAPLGQPYVLLVAIAGLGPAGVV